MKRIVFSLLVAVTLTAFPTGTASAHIDGSYHFHYVTAITGHYDTYWDYSTGYGCTGVCVAGTTETMSYSNKWGVSIQFDKAPVKAAVGYDVTQTFSRSFTFTFPVPAGVTQVIRYKDWYHITNMNVRTDWKLTTWPYSVYRQEFGTAWAGSWFQRIFYAKTV